MQNDDFRGLDESEIRILEKNGCSADDWAAVSVADGFEPEYVRGVSFHGEVQLGVFDKTLALEDGFRCHTGIYGAVLNDVGVGDNSLIMNIGAYISNTDIGEEACILGCGRIATSPGASFGQGSEISLLSETGPANVILFDGLSAQLAALTVRHASDVDFMKALRHLVSISLERSLPQRGYIGNGCKISGVGEIVNSIVGDGCEIAGASLIDDTTLASVPGVQDSVYVGPDVVLKGCVVAADASVTDGTHLENCFVDSGCRIANGFTAENSVFFANSQMIAGEAVAAFCGPFTVSHHKSSLLIGGMYSFYNAGSNTNFSNHAYKSGPVHWGVMERGSKTASGTHILWPARIGAFTMCMGKIATHPDTSSLPFSYLFGEGDASVSLLPGRNFATLGTMRDTQKWPQRDLRPKGLRRSGVCFDSLNPCIVEKCRVAINVLSQIQQSQGYDEETYEYNGCSLLNRHLVSGMQKYEEALLVYLAQNLPQDGSEPDAENPDGLSDDELKQWVDLGGLLLPVAVEQSVVKEITDGSLSSLDAVEARFLQAQKKYEAYKKAYTKLLRNSGTFASMSIDDLRQQAEAALSDWNRAVEEDREKERKMIEMMEENF